MPENRKYSESRFVLATSMNPDFWLLLLKIWRLLQKNYSTKYPLYKLHLNFFLSPRCENKFHRKNKTWVLSNGSLFHVGEFFHKNKSCKAGYKWFFVWKICHQSPKILREKISEFATFRQWLVSCSTAFSKFRFLNIIFFIFFNIKADATCNTAAESLCYFCYMNFIVVTTPKKNWTIFLGPKENPSVNSTPKLAIFVRKRCQIVFTSQKAEFFFPLAKFHQITSFFSNWGKKLVFFEVLLVPKFGWGRGKK